MRPLAELILDDASLVTARLDLSALVGKQILVTGASGLLGLHFLACFAQWQREHGGAFTGVAVTHSALPDWALELVRESGLLHVQGDLTDPQFCASLPQSDIVIHAAGYGQPGKFLENATKTIQIAVSATVALLQNLRPGGKFLFLSSSEVYSGSTQAPYREDAIGTTDPSHTRSCYIEGKRCGEAVVHAFRRQGVDAKIARIGFSYGPGTRADDVRVLNSLIRRGLTEGAIKLWDQGLASRACCYVTDAIEMMLAIVISGREPVYNVGGPEVSTILGMAHTIGTILDVPVTVPGGNQDPTAAPADVALDLTRVCGEFGKHDFVSLADGLKRTASWQRKLYLVS